MTVNTYIFFGLTISDIPLHVCLYTSNLPAFYSPPPDFFNPFSGTCACILPLQNFASLLPHPNNILSLKPFLCTLFHFCLITYLLPTPQYIFVSLVHGLTNDISYPPPPPRIFDFLLWFPYTFKYTTYIIIFDSLYHHHHPDFLSLNPFLYSHLPYISPMDNGGNPPPPPLSPPPSPGFFFSLGEGRILYGIAQYISDFLVLFLEGISGFS